MKKILILASILLFGCTTINAQHTTPRYGTTSSSDATYRNQKLSYLPKTDVAHVDTFVVYPNSLTSHLAVTLTDTVCVYASPLSAWVGDRFTITVANSAGSGHTIFLTAAGGNTNPWQVGSGTTTLSPTSAKFAIIEFMFNGVYWVETNRMVQ